jgi:hypothetical protein
LFTYWRIACPAKPPPSPVCIIRIICCGIVGGGGLEPCEAEAADDRAAGVYAVASFKKSAAFNVSVGFIFFFLSV